MDVSSFLSQSTKIKKPSTLRRPTYEPKVKYVNKQTAIAIAKKLRLSKIGNVTLRITSKQDLGSDVRQANLRKAKPTSRRMILDRNKGVTTAKNTGSSAVGKCILGPNDYESRRLSRNHDGIDEIKEQKRKHFVQKKRGFAQRQLTKLLEDHEQCQNNYSTKNQTENDNEGGGKKSGPHYMYPLNCNKKMPVDRTITEVNRFIAGNASLQLRDGQGGFGDDTTTTSTLKPVKKYNSSEEQRSVKFNLRQPTRKNLLPNESNSVIKATAKERVYNIQERVPQNRGSLTDCRATTNFDRLTSNTDHNTSDKDTFANQSSSKVNNPSITSKHQILTNNILKQKIIRQDVPKSIRTQHPSESETDSRILKCRTESRTTKSIVKQLMDLKKTEKKPKFQRTSNNIVTQNGGSNKVVLDPAKDSRFNNLASSLIPDSAKSHDLYRSMGRLSLDNEFFNQLPTIDKPQLIFLNDIQYQRHHQWENRLHTT
ncbi:uncharacterized protein LOC117111211 [Anneissia japonica]|uniref:uncharacterized protein LOC117111211 n=1 Tax=Anneissia japonica TaxID=1529436 RepID=UPI001425AA74|nr:uncharacterized protein LOC117111211 [Anneissia japonica]